MLQQQATLGHNWKNDCAALAVDRKWCGLLKQISLAVRSSVRPDAD